ncbi:hypothetical protein HYH02_005954 [Chlamydomonas schloesseri]|uniref:Uncharacterized protein n=1 Tax=Chlamydomonas schloesseri TaxID=2026947 RepID=A0A835WKS4_9CHLO|nr:hypothetical protein HYH02_005954 [Chlamydomonas schloesseri]|eukprot:KAG2449207.1 hypothetical protein HYH02_005954 [Chlamydomonas schloesseri]
MEISEFLPGRTAGEVKNIYHSTLRASRDPGRSLLRSYCMQIHGRESDVKLRREALRAAVRAMAGQQSAVATKTPREDLHYASADDEADADTVDAVAGAVQTPCAVTACDMDALLASSKAALAQLRLLVAAGGGAGGAGAGGDDWESDEGSGADGGDGSNGGGLAQATACMGARPGPGPHAGAKRAAPSGAEALPQGSGVTSGDGGEPSDVAKRARVTLPPGDPDRHGRSGLDGLVSGQASVGLEGLLGAAGLRDGNIRMQTLDLSGSGAPPGATVQKLLAQQLQALQQVQRAQQLQQQLHDAQQQQQAQQAQQDQMSRLPDAALLQLLRDEVQARSQVPGDALKALMAHAMAQPAAGDVQQRSLHDALQAQMPLDHQATPATSAGAGSTPRHGSGGCDGGGGGVSQGTAPTGPAAMPPAQLQRATGARTAAFPHSHIKLVPLGDSAGGTLAAATAVNTLALVPVPAEVSQRAARSDDRDSDRDTASDTAVGSGEVDGHGEDAARGAARPGTITWEAEQRQRIDRLLSYGISLDDIEEELLRRRQAKLAAEAAALGEAAAALAAGRRDAAAPAPGTEAPLPLQAPKGGAGLVQGGHEMRLQLEEQQELLQRLQALQPQPQVMVQVKTDPDAPSALDAHALQRQLLLELLDQQAARPQLQPQQQPQQHLTQQQQPQPLSVEGLLRLHMYTPEGIDSRGLHNLTLQAAPDLDLCASLGVQLPLPMAVPREAGDLDAWVRAKRAANMWS